MIATMEYVTILDYAENLGRMIVHSDVMQEYQNKKHALNQNKEAQALIRTFTNIKEQYEDVERFGRYHPDYHKIMKEIRVAKRAMDMHDAVAAFKVAERNLQMMLDEVSEFVAHSVSDQIKVPKDGAALSDSSCGCGSGCGCSA